MSALNTKRTPHHLTVFRHDKSIQRFQPALRAGYEDYRKGLPFDESWSRKENMSYAFFYESGRLIAANMKADGQKLWAWGKNDSWLPKWIEEGEKGARLRQGFCFPKNTNAVLAILEKNAEPQTEVFVALDYQLKAPELTLHG